MNELPLGNTDPSTLSADEMQQINGFKKAERAFAQLLKDRMDWLAQNGQSRSEGMRQLALARTALEDASMHASRSIFLPKTVWDE